MTQADLAARMRTTQTAVARMERPGANVTIKTLSRALAATGKELELSARPRKPAVDVPQLIRHMRMSPAERLAAHQVAHDNMRALLAGATSDG